MPDSKTKTAAPAPPKVPLSDRQSVAEATVLAFVAEKSLPLSMAGSLVEFAQHMARDPDALDKIALEKTSASYKMQHGLAATLQSEALEELKSGIYFSLNVDEAMTSNHQKMLTVLISFFSENLKRVVIHHLGSLPLVRVTSDCVFSS